MDDFSDDGFDELNVALLQELENKALQSLQPHSCLHPQAPPNSLFRQQADGTADTIQIDDDVDQVDNAEAKVLRELARVPAQHLFTSRTAAAAAPPPLLLPAYSQRSIADVPLPAANAGGGADRGGRANAGLYDRGLQRTSQAMRTSATAGVAVTMATTAMVAAAAAATTTASDDRMDSSLITTLQARVRTLETDLYTACGRASMVQTKFEKAQREHEAEVAQLRKQKEEELAEERRRAEAAVAAHHSAATELEFAKQDLKEEVEKGKKGRRNNRGGGGGGGGSPTTPRKGNAGRSNWNVADGFDDIEMLPSPSKGLSRRLKEAGSGATISALERTPTKGRRRRPATNSPTMPLETLVMDADGLGRSQAGTDGTYHGGASQNAKQQANEKSPLVFLQEVLGHQSHPDEPSTIELFARYSFPSNRKQTLAFLMLQRIPKLEGTQGTTRLVVDFCQLVLGIWSQCLRETYYSPVKALVSLLSYIIRRDPVGLAPHILLPLLLLSHDTGYLLAGPVFDNAGGNLSNHPDYAVRQLVSDIDTGAIMSLVRLAALGCLQLPADASAQPPSPSQASTSFPGLSVAAQTWFWSHVQFEFVLLMLSSRQPPEAFLGMLALLRTSALPDSIGPISDDPAKDASVVASTIIDRISHHMAEPPKWDYPCKYTEWDVRLSALGVLDCFAQTPFGKLSLAASDCALPRLVDIFFPAYGELRDRDLLREPLHPAAGQLPLSETEIRAYGIGGLDLAQALGGDLDKDTDSVAASWPAAKACRNTTPLVLLYVSSVVDLLYSIVTDPFTSAVANIPARLTETHCGTQSFYLLTMARLGFRVDPVFATGLHEETYRLALELFQLAATPDEGTDYSQWAQQYRSVGDAGPSCDPFSDDALRSSPERTADDMDMVT